MTRRVYPMTAPGLGPSLQDWLEGEGILDEVDAAAMVRVAALLEAEQAVRAAGKPGVGRPVGRRSKAGKQP
jgi:hypothetical protein